MYKSPIDVFITDIQHQIVKQRDDEIYQAVASVGINVDKEELLRALQYDRNQYEKGYWDGVADAKAELVRCKDCKHLGRPSCAFDTYCIECTEDTFCSYGERREGE